MIAPTNLFLSYVLQDQLSAIDDPWALKQKILIASCALNLFVGPYMASRTRAEQFLNLRKKAAKKPQPQVAAASAKAPPLRKPAEPPIQKPEPKPVQSQATNLVQVPAPTVVLSQLQGPVITL